MTFNTGNPIGSTDARDLYDNAQNLDKFSLGQELEYQDRLGVPRKSLAGIRAEVTEALSRLGYQVIGDYAAGLVVKNFGQVFRKDGEFYRAKAETTLPYQLSGDWAVDAPKFVSVGDAVLRQELALNTGSGLVGHSADITYIAGTVGAALNALAAAVEDVSVGIPGAICDGVADDTAAIQAAIDASKGVLVFDSQKTYLTTAGLNITKPMVINLNGSTIKGEFAVAEAGFNVQSNIVQIGNGSILLTGTLMGGYGGSLNCIYTGNEATGEGYHTLRYHDLTVSTNRNDAGATIGFLGENRNFIVENITVPDNSQCRNIIGMEWAGTPVGGTGHPHNGIVRNINIGRLTYPTFGAQGYAYGVWISAGFNIHVENVTMVQGYGLVMATRGDNAGTYAPESYKKLIGTGITVHNISISECFGYGICAIGSHRSGTLTPSPFNVRFRGVKVIGKKVAGNANFGLVLDQTNGVSLEDFEFGGDITAGVTTVATNDNLKISHGVVADSDVYGMSLSNDCRWPKIRDVQFVRNNKAAGTGAATAALYTGNCLAPTVEGCVFGEPGVTESQKFSVFFDSTTVRPKIKDNHTHSLASGGVAYVIGSSADYDMNASGSGNTAETGLTLRGGAPVYVIGDGGLRAFSASTPPASGTWMPGDTIVNSAPVVGGPRGWIRTTAGAWASMGNL